MSKSRSGAPRRVAAGLLAGALTVFGLALAAPAGAADAVTNDRVAGADRFGTAAASCTEAYEDGTSTVIIATGRNFPDALAASGLAGANAGCILLVEQDEVPEATVAAIDDLGASNAIIVGGTGAVSEEVETFLQDEVGVTTSRIAGDDRFETAEAIATEIGEAGEAEGGTTAILASGRSSADALAAGPLAAAGDGTNQFPILLTETNELSPSVTAAIEALDINNIVVVGGTAAVSEDVRNEAGDAAGDDDVTVLAGTDRNKTAVAIADFAETELGWPIETVLLANSRKPAEAVGADFGPDALVGGPLGGLRQAPILLVASDSDLGTDTETYLDDHSDTITELLIMGGTAAIDDIAEEAAVSAAQNTENDAATGGDTQTSSLNGPELQSCSVTGLDLDDAEAVVSYVFDTDVDTADDGLFLLYGPDTRNPVDGDDQGVEADVNGDTVDVTYSLADYNVLDLKLCAVQTGAVEDEDGNQNPPQSLGIAGALDTGKQGPDLVSAALTDDTDDEYTFTFDLSVSTTALSNSLITAEVVFEDGSDVDCTGEATSPDSDESSTEVTATCATADDNDPVRGVITFTGLNGDTVIQTAVIASGGDSDGIDLDSVILPSENDDLEANEVIFVFDEDVDSPSVGLAAVIGAFNLSYSNCSPSTSSGFELANPCAVNADRIFHDSDPTSDTVGDQEAEDLELGENEILARFEDDAINEFLVGAFVTEAANLDDEDGDGTAANNSDDAVVIEQEGWDAGDVAGPQLTGVDAVIDNTASGAFDDFEVTYTFDIAIDDDDADINGASFSVWFEAEDGEVDSFTFADGDCEADGDNTVVCTDDDEESDIGNAVVGSVDFDAVQSAATYTLSDDQESVAMPGVEASAAFDAPGFPE